MCKNVAKADELCGLHQTFTGLQRSGRVSVTDDELATGRSSVPQGSTLIRTLEHFDQAVFLNVSLVGSSLCPCDSSVSCLQLGEEPL